jgi:hypothetical protein
MAEARYVIVRKAGELDVLHVNAREECNVDDAHDRQTVDEETALALLHAEPPLARACEHCG